jgi:tetratricopeptide (TPR) repeat protein
MRRHTPITLVALLAAACLALGGCTGESRTGDVARQRAQQHQTALKAGVEWTMAQQAFEVGDLDTAYKRVQASLGLNDQVPKSHLLLGRILLEKGNLEGALDSFHTAITLDPEYSEGYYAAGVAYERMSKDGSAAASYRQAYDLDNDDAQALIAAVETSINSDNIAQAEAWAREGLSHMQHSAALHQLLGQIALLHGDYDEAIDYLEEATLLSPDDAGIQEDLTRAMYEARRYAECEHRAQRLLENPAFAERRDLKHMRAECLIQLDRGFEARELLMALVDEDPTDARAWVSLGKVAYSLGDDRRIRQAADRLIGLEPDRPEGFILRALWEWDYGDKEKALKMLERATRLGSDAATLRLSASWLHELGRHEEAVAQLAAARAQAAETATSRGAVTAVPVTE